MDNKNVKKGGRGAKLEQLTVQSITQIAQFKEWLEILGYSHHTVYSAPLQVRELLNWLGDRMADKTSITQVTQITQNDVEEFLEYFKNRPNKRRSGGLSIAHINKQIEAINLFFTYLKTTGEVPTKIKLKRLQSKELPNHKVLSRDEIEELYALTEVNLLGQRDRTILSLYYGCGLRKSEGLSLEVSDVLFERKLLYVRKTKNRHERYVPMTSRVMEELEDYIYYVRPLLYDDNKSTERLLLSERGLPLSGESLACRLKLLQTRTKKGQATGLHSLRHSIATHLLEAGVDMDNVALFLGHRTLDSTQVYTHLIKEIQ